MQYISCSHIETWDCGFTCRQLGLEKEAGLYLQCVRIITTVYLNQERCSSDLFLSAPRWLLLQRLVGVDPLSVCVVDTIADYSKVEKWLIQCFFEWKQYVTIFSNNSRRYVNINGTHQHYSFFIISDWPVGNTSSRYIAQPLTHYSILLAAAAVFLSPPLYHS